MAEPRTLTGSQTAISTHSKDAAKAGSEYSDTEAGLRAYHEENVDLSGLSLEHREYLLKRHGTIDLEPIPSPDPADPYNWPAWKKTTNLVLVSFHAMTTTFIAAAIIPAYENIAQDLGTSVARASYLTSLQIAVLGYAPLFWKPISQRYGRRPIWLISTIGALLFNVGCALSHTYSAMAVCRAFTAFFISPPGAIGSGVVTETFFKKQRAQYMGIWTLLVTLGPPTGPFLMGFVAYHTGDYRWIYWILAAMNGGQFVAYVLLAPETRYIRNHGSATAVSATAHGPSSAFKQQYLSLRRIDPSPLRAADFVQPLALFRHTAIIVPTLAYTFVFGFCSVLLTVELPQLFGPKFGFNPQQLGLQFLAVIIGSVLGEQLGGRLSDYWMNRQAPRMVSAAAGAAVAAPTAADEAKAEVEAAAGPPLVSARPAPEFRLWLSYAGFVMAMTGLVVFGVRTEQAAQGKWNVTPLVGIAIAAAGNQLVTTVLVTYAVDCHAEHSANIGVFVNLVRSTWAFIGPFWFPDMLSSLGGSGSGGLMAGIIFVCSFVPVAVLQWRGYLKRSRDHREGLAA